MSTSRDMHTCCATMIPPLCDQSAELQSVFEALPRSPLNVNGPATPDQEEDCRSEPVGCLASMIRHRVHAAIEPVIQAMSGVRQAAAMMRQGFIDARNDDPEEVNRSDSGDCKTSMSTLLSHSCPTIGEPHSSMNGAKQDPGSLTRSPSALGPAAYLDFNIDLEAIMPLAKMPSSKGLKMASYERAGILFEDDSGTRSRRMRDKRRRY